MQTRPWLFLVLLTACSNATSTNKFSPAANTSSTQASSTTIETKTFEPGSWAYFLQHLEVVDSPVVDYRGKKVRQQSKSAGIIPYDIGSRDLQQCADALIRLRAEYLFENKRHDEIGFHFVSGDYYSYKDYCSGKRPVPAGNGIKFIQSDKATVIHSSLRKYLDIVYTYASTISLARNQETASEFEVGTMVIYPGSPGHCSIIIDEGRNGEGEKVFRLAEGYTPAQSIYVLRNPDKEGVDPWHKLEKGPIETASYTFSTYQLKKFE